MESLRRDYKAAKQRESAASRHGTYDEWVSARSDTSRTYVNLIVAASKSKQS